MIAGMATSVPAAVIELYGTISATHFGGTRPPIYLNEAPQTDTDGSQRRPPYVILSDDGFRPEYDSSFGGIAKGDIRIEVYALKLEASGEITVNSITNGLRYGGGDPADRDGIDFGALPLTGVLYPVHLMPTSDRTRFSGLLDKDGKRIHVRELRYQVIYGINATT